jgi:hypothetical protein
MRMLAEADMSKFVAPEGLQAACVEDGIGSERRPLQRSLPAAAFAMEAGERGGGREVKKEEAEREGAAAPSAATTPPAGSVRCSAGGVAYICIYVRSDYV